MDLRLNPIGTLVTLVIASIVFILGGFAAEPLREKPAVAKLPQGPMGEVIQLGRELVAKTSTHERSREFVGNALNCTSCHLDNGQHAHAASFIGVATAYPAWSPREQRVITLEDRILNCFMRSCNGKRPPLGSDISVAITAYITWLSGDMRMKMNEQRPAGPRAISPLKLTAQNADKIRGEKLYTKRCAECHGQNGKGTAEHPPVWGARSYNDGAGLANVDQLAAWLKVAMPLDDATLTEQEALDIAAFVNQHERPSFRLEEHLPPDHELGKYNGARSAK